MEDLPRHLLQFHGRVPLLPVRLAGEFSPWTFHEQAAVLGNICRGDHGEACLILESLTPCICLKFKSTADEFLTLIPQSAGNSAELVII